MYLYIVGEKTGKVSNFSGKGIKFIIGTEKQSSIEKIQQYMYELRGVEVDENNIHELVADPGILIKCEFDSIIEIKD